MTSEEKTLFVFALVILIGLVAAALTLNDRDAMRSCMVEFSHDVCAHTLR